VGDKRLVYHNDMRHTFLYALEPPMSVEDARRPVDEIAGTGVDTLVCHVGDGGIVHAGLFYNTKLGLEWRAPTSDQGDWWRAARNIESLRERGLDILEILTARAHEKGMRLFGSLRMNAGNIDPASGQAIGGAGETISLEGPHGAGVALPGVEIPVASPCDPFTAVRERHADYGNADVRERCLSIVEELAGDCQLDGVELDFTAAPFYFKPDEVGENTALMTAHVQRISECVRREGRALAARVLPTEEMNLEAGLDVRSWLAGGLVDLVVPILYGFGQIDPQMPFEWLVGPAHSAGAQVTPMLDPTWLGGLLDPGEGGSTRATHAMMRAAAANAYAKGADGVYTWNLRWPPGAAERGLLTELGDSERLRGSDKQYVFRRNGGASMRMRAAGAIAAHLGYPATLPVVIPEADAGASHEVPFFLADDPEGAGERLAAITLRLRVTNLVGADAFAVAANGADLGDRLCARTTHCYRHQWLEYHLKRDDVRQGENLLAFTLKSRPEGLAGGVRVEEIEILVQYRRLADLGGRPPTL